MRATPKTSSPVHGISRNFHHGGGERLTLPDLRTEGDVLGGGTLDLLLRRHLVGSDEVVAAAAVELVST